MIAILIYYLVWPINFTAYILITLNYIDLLTSFIDILI